MTAEQGPRVPATRRPAKAPRSPGAQRPLAAVTPGAPPPASPPRSGLRLFPRENPGQTRGPAPRPRVSRPRPRPSPLTCSPRCQPEATQPLHPRCRPFGNSLGCGRTVHSAAREAARRHFLRRSRPRGGKKKKKLSCHGDRGASTSGNALERRRIVLSPALEATALVLAATLEAARGLRSAALEAAARHFRRRSRLTENGAFSCPRGRGAGTSGDALGRKNSLRSVIWEAAGLAGHAPNAGLPFSFLRKCFY